jgi:ribosome maturation factor RimP
MRFGVWARVRPEFVTGVRHVTASLAEPDTLSRHNCTRDPEEPTMPPATAGASAAQARQHLLDLLAPLVSDAGYDLEDVTVTSAGRRSLVRVIVDADGGIDLDAVAVVSRIVSDALDADAENADSPRALAGAYVLEVSSPGVDRPLTEPRHWRRALGRLVTAQHGETAVTGRVTAVDDTGATLELDGAPRHVPWAQLGRGRVQVEFNRAADASADDEED